MLGSQFLAGKQASNGKLGPAALVLLDGSHVALEM